MSSLNSSKFLLESMSVNFSLSFYFVGIGFKCCKMIFQELDWESIAAGLLHDTVEDTNTVSFERIEEEFGATVRHIVEGETKVVSSPFLLHTRMHSQINSQSWMLIQELLLDIVISIVFDGLRYLSLENSSVRMKVILYRM